MARILIQEAASLRLDDIYRYTRERWGREQADRYITGMFEAFEKINTHEVFSKPIPAEFGANGYFFPLPEAFRVLETTGKRGNRHRHHPPRKDASDRPV